MQKKFVIKKLVESHEIQESYDRKEYYEAVVKCRIYLESWLAEYIYAILFPVDVGPSGENRKFIAQRFENMYLQIQWLRQQVYISKNDFDNLNKIRAFCDNVFRKGDVFKIVSMDQLDKFIEMSIYYCDKFKNLTMKEIEKARVK